MRFPSMVRRLRNTQGGGTRSTAGSGSTSYNEPPVADAGSDQIVSQGDTVQLTGSVSNAPASVVLNCKWTFGDETNPTAVGNGMTASYTYTTHGNKTARLTVSYTDTNGKLVEASDDVIITVIELTLEGPATVTRGETAKYTATVKPDGLEPTFSWEFTDAEGDGLPIPGDTGTRNTWIGAMAVSGTVEVTASVNNEDFTKSLETTVQPREWEDTFPEPPMEPVDGYGTLEQLPESAGDLGHTVAPGTTGFTIPTASASGSLITSGPNNGWVYIKNPPLGEDAWDMEIHISPALTNEDHPFYRHNANRNRLLPDGRRFPFYMEKLHQSVRIHEGVEEDPDGHYKSHMGEGFDQISNDPINPWAEDKVKYQNTGGVAQKFIDQIQMDLNTKLERVRTKFERHPVSKYFDPDPRRRFEHIPPPNFEY